MCWHPVSGCLASVEEEKGRVPALVVTLRLVGQRRGKSTLSGDTPACSGGPCFPPEETEAQSPGRGLRTGHGAGAGRADWKPTGRLGVTSGALPSQAASPSPDSLEQLPTAAVPRVGTGRGPGSEPGVGGLPREGLLCQLSGGDWQDPGLEHRPPLEPRTRAGYDRDLLGAAGQCTGAARPGWMKNSVCVVSLCFFKKGQQRSGR